MGSSKFVCANIVLQQNVAKLLIETKIPVSEIFVLKIIGRD